MRFATAALFVGLSMFSTAQAASPRPPGYEVTESQLGSIDLNDRVLLQVMLIAGGHLNAVPTEGLSMRLFNAIRSAQAEAGLLQTAALDEATIKAIFAQGVPMLKMWRFRRVEHPAVRVAVWMPTGMGLSVQRTENGIRYGDGRFQASLNAFENFDTPTAYRAMLEKWAAMARR